MPKAIRLAALTLSIAVLMSSLAGAAGAILISQWVPNQPPIWSMVGFELVIAMACVFGVLVALGRFAEGPGLALFCVAGAVFMGSVLGFHGAAWQLGNFSLKVPLLARLAAAGVLAALAATTVLARHPRSPALAFKGLLLLLPAMALGAVVFLAWRTSKLDGIMAQLFQLPMAVKMAAGGILVSAVGVGLCIGIDMVIRAFELGRLESSDAREPASTLTPPGAPTATASAT